METKPMEEIAEMVEGLDRVAVVGCSKCAKSNQVGGADQVEAMTSRLEEMGKTVVEKLVLDGICTLPNSGDGIDGIPENDGVLVMACGAGCQAIIDRRPGLNVLPGADTLFLGVYQRKGEFLKRCALCGDCILHLTGGVCPVARCPKSMTRGPCGDAVGGKCGISKSEGMEERECVWVEIHRRGGSGRSMDWSKQVKSCIRLSRREINRGKGLGP